MAREYIAWKMVETYISGGTRDKTYPSEQGACILTKQVAGMLDVRSLEKFSVIWSPRQAKWSFNKLPLGGI